MRSASDELRATLAADAAQLSRGRLQAARLDAVEPDWHIWCGPGKRELFAFPQWDRGCVLLATDPDARHAASRAEQGDRSGQVPDHRAGTQPVPHQAVPRAVLADGAAAPGPAARATSTPWPPWSSR